LANASWGGVQYFSIPIALLFIALPFFRKDTEIPLYVTVVYTLFTIISVVGFPRPGVSFLFSFPGIALIGATVFLVNAHYLKKLSSQRKEGRNILFLLIAFLAIALTIIGSGVLYSNPRYLNAINPFFSSESSSQSGQALLESVSEHSIPTFIEYFTNYSVLLMFAGFGAWVAFKRSDLLSIFALIIGVSGVYVSGGFVRLLVYASIGIIILAAIGSGEVIRSILQNRESTAITPDRRAKVDLLTLNGNNRKFVKIVSIIVIIFIISFPLVYPRNMNWLTSADVPPPIVTDGRGIPSQTNDWIDALNWISNNTPTNSVIASWWDYGYWIETLGNRTTLADNANYRIIRTVTMAKMFLDQEETGITIAQKLGADYILIYVEAERFDAPNGTYYSFGYGGDESKMLGMMRIGGFDENKYLERDKFTATPLFWNASLLGKLIPLTNEGYAKFENGQLANFSDSYTNDSIALYSKQVKYPDNDTNKRQQPLSLVYSSESFKNSHDKMMTAVLIYRVNHDYDFQ
jgi:dolichyl-diphosphooligosaccharide--protein glycosyltransferase